VEAANTSGTHQYNYKDKNVPDLGYLRVYYRISEIDNDNHFSYSKEVSIPIPNQPNSIVFYPNPVANQGQMRIIVSRGEKMQWRLFDNTGRIIKQATANLVTGINSVPVSLGGLAAGIYYIELKGETINKRIRLMKE
ncbi:MAG: T9SS type A sorting domain-containing protein, partial [Chitinophagaceae bacterium]|nr:T9SS type A sorting domain-containing protein [Chitinophagaceae bacterium]